ncbi:hypothetical protein BDM02DRAFT_3063063, partial [Thelephora ganbajun]
KISLPDFLQQLTSNRIPHSKAIQVASKIYKTHHTPTALVRLTDTSLKSLGIEERDLRRLTLAAFKKGGWKLTSTETLTSQPPNHTQASNTTPPGSRTYAHKRKRNTVDDELPDRPPEEMESAKYGNFDFKEVLDEDLLKIKSTVINRAPVMTAWATIVAERLGFGREEALSIASVYTETNATSKGISIGVHSSEKNEISQKSMDETQPYVDLMGRRITLYRFQLSYDQSQWRALSSGKAVPPLDAYKYITTSLKQTTPYILGAMRLLAESYEPGELNRKGFSLYCDFRPEIEPGKSGWGKRGKVPCEVILRLRKE